MVPGYRNRSSVQVVDIDPRQHRLRILPDLFTGSIIDFKTSGRWKQKSYCEDYFRQAAYYAIAVEELTGQPVPQLVILIAGDAGEQEFIEKRNTWAPSLIERIKEYKNE